MSQNAIQAVLVRLSIASFPNLREDPSMTAGVKELHKLTGKAGKWMKYKLPQEALKPWVQIQGEIRTWNYRVTLPWEEGYRLLPAAGITSYTEQSERYIATANEIADAIADQFNGLVEQARIMHNGTFNEADYPPTKEAFRATFGVAFEHSPVPERSHFVNEVAGAQLRSMQASLEARNRERMDFAVQDLWRRLLAPVQHMADALAQPKPIFRDTLVENVREIIELVPALNLTGNAQLKAATDAMQRALAGLSADTLRESKVERKAAVQAAEKIIKQFGSFAQRKLAK